MPASQYSHGTPSTEAAASPVDAPRGLLLVSNATMMYSALKDTARELGVNAEWRLFYAAHSSHAGKPAYNMQLTKVIGSRQAHRSWCVVTARTCSSSPVTMSGPLISKNAAARIDGFRAGNIAAGALSNDGFKATRPVAARAGELAVDGGGIVAMAVRRSTHHPQTPRPARPADSGPVDAPEGTVGGCDST